MATTRTTEFFLISRTENVLRLQGKKYRLHFPGDKVFKGRKRPLCGTWAPHQYRVLDVKVWLKDSDLISICEHCLTLSDEH